MPTPSKLANILHGFCHYLFWTWGPVFLMFVAHILVPSLEYARSPWSLLPLVLNGIFTAGVAVYLGLRLGANDNLVPRGYILHGAGAVMSILAGEAASGSLYCLGLATHAKLYGIGVLKPGGAAGSFYLNLSLEMLSATLLAGLISCALGCAIGIVAGATLRSGSGNLTSRKSAWCWHSTRAVAIVVCGFTAINVAGLYGRFTNLVFLVSVWGNGHVLWPLTEVSMVLTSLLGDNIWACIAVLWFLWLRGCNNVPGWQKWLLFAPLAGAAAFFILPML